MTQQINLVDASLLPPQRLLPASALMALLAALAALVLAHLSFERHAMQQALQAPAEPSASNAADGAPTSDADAALQARIAQRQALRRLLRQNEGLPEASAALLGDVIAALPDSMWLTEIDLGAARAIRIAGGTTDASALAAFADRLARIPALRGVPIEAVRLELRKAESEAGADAPAASMPSHSFVLAGGAQPGSGGAP